MIISKIKVDKVTDLKEKMEIEADNWMIVDGKVVTYSIEKKDISSLETVTSSPKEEAAENYERKKLEEWLEFVKKNQIRCGIHKFDSNEGMVEIENSEEVFFETKTSAYLKKLFFNFFEKSTLLRDKFKKNKRAYLLYSDVGMGKSALIRDFCRHALKKTGTAVIIADGDVNFSYLTNVFLKKYDENVERIILVIEDFGKKDNLSVGAMYNPTCLNFLDGTSGLFRVPTMILCTTNFVKELGPQLTNRPGRFNKIIQVLPPTDEEIFELVEGIGNIKLIEKQKQVFKGRNMTPDHVIEAIIRHELEEISLEEAANQVMKEREGIVSWE